MNKRALIVLGLCGVLTFSIGAATGSKISAELRQQTIVANGSSSNQSVISYNGGTYVPLRAFSDMVNIPVDYQNGIVYVGGITSQSAVVPTTSPSNPQSTKNSIFEFGEAKAEKAAIGDELVAVVDMKLKNDSGKVMCPYDSGYTFTAYQNGVEVDLTLNTGSEYNNVMTNVQSGHTLEFKAMFYIKDKSPITVEIINKKTKDKISKTLNLG